MHLSSHSVGSHHGIIAKHSLFVLKIPSVHVTVKVSQWKNTNNKLSLFSFIFLFLNLQVERMASFTLPSLSALRHLQPSYGLTPRAVEATLVYTVLTASWRPDVDPFLNSSFFAVSFLLHITTKALYPSNYVICYSIGLSSGLSCSMKQTTTKSLICVTNKCNSYTQQMLSFSFLQHIILCAR